MLVAIIALGILLWTNQVIPLWAKIVLTVLVVLEMTYEVRSAGKKKKGDLPDQTKPISPSPSLSKRSDLQ